MNQTLEKEAVQEKDSAILTFRLADEMFGVDIRHVREIIEFSTVTPVPMARHHVRGVINLRGSVAPVIDLQSLFWKREASTSRRSCIIIVEAQTADGTSVLTGILVDSVSEVLEIQASEIERPPGFGANLRSDFIRGMVKVGDVIVIIVEMQRLLAAEQVQEIASMDFSREFSQTQAEKPAKTE